MDRRAVSNFQRRSRVGASRGACNGSSAVGESSGFRHSVGGALTFGTVATVPKNTLRAFSNESSAIGFTCFIQVFDLFDQLSPGGIMKDAKTDTCTVWDTFAG